MTQICGFWFSYFLSNLITLYTKQCFFYFLSYSWNIFPISSYWTIMQKTVVILKSLTFQILSNPLVPSSLSTKDWNDTQPSFSHMVKFTTASWTVMLWSQGDRSRRRWGWWWDGSVKHSISNISITEEGPLSTQTRCGPTPAWEYLDGQLMRDWVSPSASIWRDQSVPWFALTLH